MYLLLYIFVQDTCFVGFVGFYPDVLSKIHQVTMTTQIVNI